MDCPEKSVTPYIVIIGTLSLIIVALIVYFFMFYKPPQDVCSNLHRSNICTTSYCTKSFPCTKDEWKPEIQTDKDNFLGWSFKYPKDSGISSLVSDYDTKACAYIKQKNLDAYAGDNIAPGTAVRLNCDKILNDIDDDIDDANNDWMLKSNLLKVRRAIHKACGSGDEITSSAFKDGGAVATVFCKPK